MAWETLSRLVPPKEQPTERNEDQIQERVQINQADQSAKHKIHRCHQKTSLLPSVPALGYSDTSSQDPRVVLVSGNTPTNANTNRSPAKP